VNVNCDVIVLFDACFHSSGVSVSVRVVCVVE